LLFLAGSFFRKLLQHKPADAISGSKSPTGKNILAAFPSRISQVLGLPNFSTYTGHCWRRTTATIAAGKGMTIPQIKQITGHRSDTVVQGYIDSSIYTKSNASSTLAIGGENKTDNTRSNKRLASFNPNQHYSPKKSRSNVENQIIYNLTINGDIAAPFSLVGWSNPAVSAAAGNTSSSTAAATTIAGVLGSLSVDDDDEEEVY
jgi:hypothetical protein